MKLIYITSSHSCNFLNKFFIRNSLCSLSPYLHTYTVERSDSVFFITVFTYLHSVPIWYCVLYHRIYILTQWNDLTLCSLSPIYILTQWNDLTLCSAVYTTNGDIKRKAGGDRKKRGRGRERMKGRDREKEGQERESE